MIHDESPQSRAASTAWLEQLRERFIAITRRRVAADAVEDLVQDALRIVVERGVRGPGSLLAGGEPALSYCLQILRNVIGNHYQKERVQRRRRVPAAPGEHVADAAMTPLESVASEEAVRIVHECIGAMRETDPVCARYLLHLAEGRSPRELAREEQVEEEALYRRVYRCRIKLRGLLARRGIES